MRAGGDWVRRTVAIERAQGFGWHVSGSIARHLSWPSVATASSSAQTGPGKRSSAISLPPRLGEHEIQPPLAVGPCILDCLCVVPVNGLP